ncbi:MAG: hypothetical protein HN534_00280 [Euryarchaeota archaeon]|nr:hypothetical protein [Euryarchaeota archaeon]MBT3653358.1 hypothetical protein [Euryarchaeota archaeon]MBT3758226.1 hypothetical protein [Euryarchaeota archaeon]MBT4051335.1 hypothetical protein [Euryarchaeota archaeon]MBT4346627.1 hypothetical protein [Euryarchaeota archaeon]
MADILLYLVERESYFLLCQKPLLKIFEGMKTRSLRGFRPIINENFHREFDVDLEGEILEWFDSNQDFSLDIPLEDQTMNIERISELAILFARWCSYSEWRCWDARLFLYVEPIIGRKIEDVDEFLEYSIWSEFSLKLMDLVSSEYSESVILDWMGRREKLGETMEPSKDPRILPTMAAHRLAAESLHEFLKSVQNEKNSLLIGREFLNSLLWKFDKLSMAEHMAVNR